MARATKKNMTTIHIDIPIGESESKSTGHIDTRFTAEQARTLNRIRAALDSSNARLNPRSYDQPGELGRPVLSNADALRWLLEQIGRTIESA